MREREQLKKWFDTINVDEAVFPETQTVYYSAAAKNGPARSMSNPQLMEAMAIKEALSWILDRG